MNWITNSVLPKIKAWVKAEDVPDNLWIKCSACGQMIFHREYEKAFNCCATCGLIVLLSWNYFTRLWCIYE